MRIFHRALLPWLAAALAACATARPASSPAAAPPPLRQAAPARTVAVPPYPPLRPPEPGAGPRLAALAGAWEGTWSDGAPAALLVLELGPAEARVLLASDGHDDPAHPAWHAFVYADVREDPAPALAWTDGALTTTFTLGDDGLLHGVFDAPWGHLEVAMHRRAGPPPVTPGTASPAEGPLTCPDFAPRLAAIEAAPSPAGRTALVEALLAEARRSGTPLLGAGRRPGQGCATLLWRGEARHVAVAGDMNGWSRARDLMARVPGTDLFHAGYLLPDDARLDYKLLPDGKWTLDPLNPRTMTGGYGPNSELAMPGYRPPPEVVRDPAVPSGTVEKLRLVSRHLGNGRWAQVYLPPGYAGGTERYPVLYLHDGEDALAFGALDAVLDNLIAARAIPPLVAVLVPPVRRGPEYRRNPAFEAFFVEEVVPTVDATYRTVAAPAGRVVGGISLGGLAALSLALGHPEVFGGCIAQSSWLGDLQPAVEALARPAAAGRPPPPAVWLDVGRFEAVMQGADLVRTQRRLRGVLEAAGVRVSALEVPEGHSWGSWRARTGAAIRFVLGGGAGVPAAPRSP